MWVKLPSKAYVNLDTNARLDVSRVENNQWRVTHIPEHGHANTLGTGYASEEEARGVLDEFVGTNLEFVEVQPPVTEEEV